MEYRRKLFSFPTPYDLDGSRALFLQAIEENVRFHYHSCPEYQKIVQAQRFSPRPLQNEEDLAQLPFLPTILFKRHDLRSMEGKKFLLTATSSGTGGRPSSIQFDMDGLFCGLRMVLRLGRYHHLFSPVPTNYIVMGYKPRRDNHAAAVKTAFGATLFAPAIRRRYALLYRDGKYVPDLDGVIQSIISYSRSSLPTRFMGFPSYTYFVLRRMEEQGITVKLKTGSKIMLGGEAGSSFILSRWIKKPYMPWRNVYWGYRNRLSKNFLAQWNTPFYIAAVLIIVFMSRFTAVLSFGMFTPYNLFHMDVRGW